MFCIGCNKEHSTSVTAYYYPIDKIENYVVYEYNVEYQGGVPLGKSYLKIGKIDTSKYYISSLSNNLERVDSSIFVHKEGNIYLEQMYLHIGDTMIINDEEMELIYPSEVRHGIDYRSFLTFSNLNHNEVKSIQHITDASLMQFDSLRMKIKLETQISVSKHKGHKDSFLEVSEILNVKDTGLVTKVSRSSTGIELTRLQKIYSSEEWMNLVKTQKANQ